jgi:uncharacterized repeat protein (TIGR03803 family)
VNLFDKLRRMRSWLAANNWPRAVSCARRPTYRPQLEILEDRLTLSLSITTLATFNGTNGAAPRGALMQDSSGNLFGTTTQGGAQGYGTVFELKADSSGNLFGSTRLGPGYGNTGTIFEVKAGSGTITTLASFDGTNGGVPFSLIEDSSGNLFGTSLGISGASTTTVFEVKAGSRTITTLASFGYFAYAGGLVEDNSGNLFGAIGGAFGQAGLVGYGTLFELKAGSRTITTLASFDGTNGRQPLGGLIEDNGGNLFGTTSLGGTNNGGTVFELKAGSSTITTLGSFNSTTGTYSAAGLVEDSSGNLFGTTSSGGANNNGTLFEVNARHGAMTTLTSFDAPISIGGLPLYTTQNPLILDASGNLFGTTDLGGVNGDGTVFELRADVEDDRGRDQRAVLPDGTLIQFTNTGNAAAAAILISDNLPANSTFVGGSVPWSTKSGTVYTFAAPNPLAGGGILQFTFIVQLNPGTRRGLTIVNHMSVSDDQGQDAPVDTK